MVYCKGKELETLIQRSTMFSYKNVHLFLFAKSGFTKGCMDQVSELGNINLVTYADSLKNILYNLY